MAKMKLNKAEARERDVKIWLLRRGDNLSIRQIGAMANLSSWTVRKHLQITDRRVALSSLNPTSALFGRLLASNALSSFYVYPYNDYDFHEVFNSIESQEAVKVQG